MTGVAVALFAWGALAGPVTGQDPTEAWRTFETEHFRVTFPEPYEDLARRAAHHAEGAWDALASSLVEPPDGRVELLVTDHADFSNGFADVAPYRRITVFARPPVDGFSLSYFDDWLELVIVHELAHVFHLDVGGPLSRVLRAVFGNVPVTWPFFPARAVPAWTVEGLATWYESHHTGAGRAAGTGHAMVVRTAALEGRFEALDQASGDSPVWPAGERPYAYGSLFFDYLVDRFGRERMGEFVEAVGDQVLPYRLDAAAEESFGVSFSEAWRDWREETVEEAERLREQPGVTRPERLTEGARRGLHPRVAPSGERLVYSRSDGRSDAHLRVAALDGSEGRSLTRTNGASVASWLPDGRLVFAQFGLDGPYRIFSDLHLVEASGEVRRITSEARLDHPAAAPDGTVVAVQNGAGTTRLVEVDLDSGELRPLTPRSPDVHWAFPAVSPDGRWIAASRWSDGGLFDVVVLDREGSLVARATRDRAVDMAPSWTPDGRYVIWGSDRSGIPDLYAAEFRSGSREFGAVRRITRVLTGAAFPSVDPRERWIYFSGYHADGWEVERIPFDPTAWTPADPPLPRFREGPVDEDVPRSPGGSARAYSPWPSVLPRHWEPEVKEPARAAGRTIIGRSFGFSTESRDLVGRHAFDASAVFSTSGGKADGFVSYRYAGLGNPILGISATQFWTGAGPLTGTTEDGTEERLWIEERERSLGASVTRLFPGFRTSASVGLNVDLAWERRTLLDDALRPSERFTLLRPDARFADVSLDVALSTARSHAFSIGPERGAALFLRGRIRSQLALPDSLAGVVGGDRSVDDVIGRLRLYRSIPGPGFANHVLAVQGSGGIAGGPGADRFHYRVGGNSGEREPITGFSLFGGPTFFFPVRGYTNGDRTGRYAWTVSVEYRVPLVLANRGVDLLPVHLDRMSGSLFFDAGNAWGPELDLGDGRFDNPRRSALTAVGAEVVTRMLSFFTIPLTLRTGVAVPLVDVRGGRAASVYVRIGQNF